MTGKNLDGQLFANEVEEANEYGAGRWKISKNSWNDWQIKTTKRFKKGDLVLTSCCLQAQSARTSHSIQKTYKSHVIMNLPCRFLNHSCSANLGPWDNLAGAYDFIALRDIDIDEELTFDYDTTEFEVQHFPDKCLCESDKCRGLIMGYKKNLDLQMNSKKLVAKFLTELTN